MNNFVYDIPTRVYFGKDNLSTLGSQVASFGSNVLLVYGGGTIKKIGLYDKVIAQLEKAKLNVFELSGIEPNPRITSVRQGVKLCKENKIDVLLAVGGGSTIDATKFIGAGVYYDGDPWDFLTRKAEIVNCLPIVSILTLSATGSEMDNCGVISNLENNDKLANGHYSMVPKVSYLDPTNTFTVSKYQTACGSVDILSHIFEVYFNTNDSMYMLDRVMEGLIKTVIHYAPIAYNDPTNYEARANLMWASSWAINGFVSADKTHAWTCHPLEHELSAYYDITHGLGLAILTPRFMRYTLDEGTVDKFYQFGVNVFDIDKTLDKMQVANLAIEKIEHLFFNTLELSSNLTKLGISDEHFKTMASKITAKGNLTGFKTLSADDIENIYKNCL